MRSSRIVRSLCAALTSVACAGVITGCVSSGEVIPLAKVPPPPESFSRVQAKAKIPKSASPANANEMRR